MRKRTNKLITFILTMCISVGMTVSVDAYSANAPFGNTGYNSYKHNDRFKGYLMVDGVDVSEYQSTKTNWTTAKKNNVDFAILRGTWTGYSAEKHSYEHKDSNFKTLYANAKKSGVMLGVYGFSQATTEAEAQAEANYLVKTLKDAGVKPADLLLPVYMDYEFAGPSSGKRADIGRMHYYKTNTDSTHPSKFTKSLATKCAKAYCDVIRAAGYKPGVYANTSFFSNWLTSGSLGSDVDLWCAQYYNENTSSAKYTKWQFTSSANIKGVLNSAGKIGSTDANFWYIQKNPTSTDASNLASCTVYGATDWNYTGSAILPKFEIYNQSGTLLAEGTDYSVGYINNIVKGNQQAYVYILGAGSYNGYLLIPFTIGSGYVNHLGLAESATTESGFVVDNYRVPEVTVAEDQTVVTEEEFEYLPENHDFGIKSNRIEVAESELKVRDFLAGLVLASEADGYSLEVINTKGQKQSDEILIKTGMMLAVKNANGTRVGTADIAVANDSIKNRTANNPSRSLLSMSLKTTSYYYDGSVKHPGVVVKFNGSTIANGITATNTDVKVSYSSGCKKPGTYKAAVTGKTCPGSSSKSFTIKVKPTSIKSLSKGKKSFTVKVNKQASKYVTGYQVKYSEYSSMKKSKTKTIGTKYTAVKKKITKLSNKKTYYVKVRTYKKINGKKYYSSWSAVKKVKTK